MPKTSGAVLDWVPQKAAQQMHSDAMTRFMPKSRVAFPVGAAQRQVVGASRRRRKSAHIFDPFARGSQVRADWRDQPATAHARRTNASMVWLDGRQTAGEGGHLGIVTRLRSAVPRPRPSAPGQISLPRTRTRSRTGTLPSRYGPRLRPDRSTA